MEAKLTAHKGYARDDTSGSCHSERSVAQRRTCFLVVGWRLRSDPARLSARTGFVDTKTYQFKIGAFHCLAVSDGTFVYPPAGVFANATKEEHEAALGERHLPLDEVKTPYTCLYLDTGEHRVLVDTGAGKLAPTTGPLVKNLERAGIDPRSIDTVILTHAHPDHIGGNVDSNGSLRSARFILSGVSCDVIADGAKVLKGGIPSK
jgi:hypothetical protein